MERWSNREKIVVRRVLKALKTRGVSIVETTHIPSATPMAALPVFILTTAADKLAAEWDVDLNLPSPDPRADGRRPRRRRPRRDNAVAQAARSAG